MSFRSVGTLLPPRRVKRILTRKQYGTPRMKSAPLLARPMRVVLRLQPGMETGEELLLLGALEELKRLHDRIDLEYVTSNPQVLALLKGNWFLKDAHLAGSQSMFEAVVGDDISVTLFEPDPQAAAIAEEEYYRSHFQQTLEAKQAIQQMYQERGMKDLVVDMPTYQFQSKWSKTNAYLWATTDRLGLTITVPSAPIPPYGGVPKAVRRQSQAAASKARLTSQPFGVYDLRSEADEIGLAGVVGKTLHPLRMIAVQELEKVVGTDIGSYMALFENTNCRFVIAPVGDLLYAAWAVRVRNVMTLYQGANPNWDAAQTENSFPFLRDQYDDEKLPQALHQSLRYMLEMSNG